MVKRLAVMRRRLAGAWRLARGAVATVGPGGVARLALPGGRRGSLVQVETTNRCNFHCVYCPTHSPDSTLAVTKGTMDLAAFERLLDGHPRARMVHLQGQGEPLVDPGLAEKLAACRRRRLYTQVISNGSLLRGEVAARLLDAGLDSLLVSIDVAPPEVVEATRRGMDYARVVENVRAFVAARDAARRRTAVGIISVFYGADEARIEEALLGFDDLGIDLLLFKELNASFENRIRGYRAERPALRAVERVRPRVGYWIAHQRGAGRDKPCLWLRHDFAYHLVDGRRTACCVLNDAQYADEATWGRDALLDRWRRRDLPSECTSCSYFGGYD